MSDKKSKTVKVGKIKRHKAPGRNAPPMKISHYGNGWNGGNPRRPQSPSAPSGSPYEGYQNH